MPCHVQWIVHRLISVIKTKVGLDMAEAWKLAQERISKAHTHQRKQHDKLLKTASSLKEMLSFFMILHSKQRKHTNLQNHSVVPTRYVVHLVRGRAEIQLVVKPKFKLIRVTFNRL